MMMDEAAREAEFSFPTPVGGALLEGGPGGPHVLRRREIQRIPSAKGLIVLYRHREQREMHLG
jgi:hypothetical protein